MLREALAELCSAPYAPESFAALVRDQRLKWPGNDYARELTLANVAEAKANIAPRDLLLLLNKFVNSTDFLYAPVAPDAVGAAWGSMAPNDTQLYNGNLVSLEALRRVVMTHANGLSAKTTAELQVYLASHGSLPPEFAGAAKPATA